MIYKAILAKTYFELVTKYQKYFTKICPSDDVCIDPLLAADPIPLSMKSKDFSDLTLSLPDSKKLMNEITKMQTMPPKSSLAQDCISSPTSPLNRSQDSASQISENKKPNPTATSKPKKTCSANLTADSQDCQVINMSDSDSNLDIDAPQLNSFYNDVQTTDDYITYNSHFEGGGTYY